jgi:hypothetical protein
VTPPLYKLTGQGNNREPDRDVTRWLVWCFLSLVLWLWILKATGAV